MRVLPWCRNKMTYMAVLIRDNRASWACASLDCLKDPRLPVEESSSARSRHFPFYAPYIERASLTDPSSAPVSSYGSEQLVKPLVAESNAVPPTPNVPDVLVFKLLT